MNPVHSSRVSSPTASTSTPPAAARASRSGSPGSAPERHGATKSASTIKAKLNQVLGEGMAHQKACGKLYRQLSALESAPSRKVLTALTSNQKKVLGELMALLKDRQDTLDEATTAVRELLASSKIKNKGAMRTSRERACRESESISHRITIYRAVLGFDQWNTDMAVLPATPKDLFSMMRRNSNLLAAHIDTLRHIPPDTQLGFPINDGSVASHQLFVMAWTIGLPLSFQLTEINSSLAGNGFPLCRHGWDQLETDAKPVIASSIQQGVAQDTHLDLLRDGVKVCDQRIYYLQWHGTPHDHFELTSQLESYWIALDYCARLIKVQAVIPASASETVDGEKLIGRLATSLSKNISVLADGLLDALEPVSFGIPASPHDSYNERLKTRSDAKWNWLVDKHSEITASCAKLMRLHSAFVDARTRTQLLALGTGTRRKRAARQPVDVLVRLSDDFGLVADQIAKYLDDLRALLPSVRTLDVADAPLVLSWEPSGTDDDVTQERAPMTGSASAPSRAPAVPATAQEAPTTSEAQRASASQPGPEARNTGKFERLEADATQMHNLAENCLGKLRSGDTSSAHSSGTVEFALDRAIEYRKKQRRHLAAQLKHDHSPDLKRKHDNLEKQIARLVKKSSKLIAEAISLRPTHDGVLSALRRGIPLSVEQPQVLPVSRSDDFIHRYVITIDGYLFKLHAHYDTANPTPDREPTAIHYKRYDEGGYDNEAPVDYYQDRRSSNAKGVYRSRRAREAIALFQEMLPPDMRRPKATETRHPR